MYNDPMMQQQLSMAMAQNPLMGMGMGMMSNMTSTFLFTGNQMSLNSRIDSLSQEQISKIREVTIILQGTEVKTFNLCCYITTIILGGIFILPLFCLCCNWWEKMVYPLYQVNLFTYQSLEKLFQGSNVNVINLTINDNFFDRQKANLLYQMLSRCTAKGFIFSNISYPLNLDNSEYSDFVTNMKPIKNLSINSVMRWYRNIVL